MKSEVSKQQRFDQSGQVKCHRLKQQTVSNNTVAARLTENTQRAIRACTSGEDDSMPVRRVSQECFNDARQCGGGFDGLNIILTAEHSH